jgi:hypothetical protein
MSVDQQKVREAMQTGREAARAILIEAHDKIGQFELYVAFLSGVTDSVSGAAIAASPEENFENVKNALRNAARAGFVVGLTCHQSDVVARNMKDFL